ncbi:nitrogenase stabilizing/protective protein NifW [Methylocystis sp.]|uniref:nitrogenase stabilizing/protective protein NifW n=1 Tax=Methylocystis sp. TaxID=1911079 RepID=UPI003DA33AEE
MKETKMSEPSILEQLKKASCAEEFFELLGVDYDPKVVNVARLHILRRMGQYLFSEDLCELDGATVAQRCKDFLERAYQDFLTSTPIDERLFKVHKDAVKPAAPPALVQLNVLK